MSSRCWEGFSTGVQVNFALCSMRRRFEFHLTLSPFTFHLSPLTFHLSPFTFHLHLLPFTPCPRPSPFYSLPSPFSSYHDPPPPYLQRSAYILCQRFAVLRNTARQHLQATVSNECRHFVSAHSLMEHSCVATFTSHLSPFYFLG